MSDPKPPSTLRQVSDLIGLQPGVMSKIWEEVKANHAKLEQCKGHDFSRPYKQRGELVTDWMCSKCGGHVDTSHKRWYELGLKHGLSRG
jgi:hypothetical protein